MNKKRFFPVIHCLLSDSKIISGSHAVYNTQIAIDQGADGVFLIGHGMHHEDLCSIYQDVRNTLPGVWIGINFLDIRSEDVAKLSKAVLNLDRLNGLWMDSLPASRLNLPTNIETFGGVAFKYIEPDMRGERLRESCKRALEVVDTITTSGTKTGSAPDIEKLEEIRGNIGTSSQFALASGVTEDNVSLFLPTVDTFLVATSITNKPSRKGDAEHLIRDKVWGLADKIHSY